MARKPLNPRQVEVLQWIADDCPDGVWPDFTYKTTAVALQGRRLAKVSKRGGWHAEITDDGRFYLAHGAYPDQPAPVARPVKVRPLPVQPSELPSEPDPAPQDESKPADSPADGKPPIVVPSQLRNPHPAVTQLRDDKDRLGLTVGVRGRALRVLQALTVAAEEQGWTVRAPKVRRRNEHGYSRFESANHLIVETGEQRLGIRIAQLTDRSPHVPTQEELRRQESWGSAPPKYDHTPNGYLRIELDGGWDGKQSNFSEGLRGPIDRKLHRVIDEIAHRSERAKERRLERVAQEEERARRYEQAVERAKVLLQQEHRAQVLLEQISQFTQAAQIRAYVRTMEAAAEGLGEGARSAAYEWIAWAARYADALDPLKRELRIPEDPEPTEDALRPFLRW